MQFVRLYTERDGQTHFQYTPLNFEKGDIGEVALLGRPEGVVYVRRVYPNHPANWHTAPRRQYVLLMSGGMEIQVPDGTVVRFKPGDALLAEEVTGIGHITRTLGTEPRVLFNVPLLD
jgi:hypothetical protein